MDRQTGHSQLYFDTLAEYSPSGQSGITLRIGVPSTAGIGVLGWKLRESHGCKPSGVNMMVRTSLLLPNEG